MSECVVRIDMPKGCWDCPCVNGEYGYCQADKDERQIEDPNERPSWCPIICQLPKGHGRLVDKDEMLKKIENYHRYMTVGRESDPRCIIEDAPTIVPAGAERKVDEPDAVSPTDTPTDTPTVPAERSET